MKSMKAALILTILLACILALSAAIPLEERDALDDLYAATSGGSWYNHTNWEGVFDDGHPWFGVQTTGTGDNETVIALYLGENNLTGPIPDSLENLKNLYSLHLFNNRLTGIIPPKLGNIKSLHALWLTANQLRGSIPWNLGKLGNLQHLILNSNELTGEIPSELGDLSILHFLHLQNNQLEGDIPLELGKLSQLEELFLESNQLTGGIPPELGNLSNLRALFLDGNRLSGNIPSSLGNLSNLQSLLLNSNQLDGEIPVSLANLNPSTINIGYNALYSSDSGLRAFLDSKSPGWASTQTVAPTNVTAVPGDASVTVSWNPIPYNWDSGGYRIYFAEEILGLIGSYSLYAQTGNKAASSQVVSGLTNGHTYHFKVQTRTDAHANNQNMVESEFSNTAWATPTMVWITALTLTSLNGGESLTAGSSQNVTWTTTGTVANVKLEYSTNNGTSWTSIIASTANANSYVWTIPNTPSTACLFRLSDASNPSVYDISNGTFTILPASPAAQRQALIDLYNSTNGAAWTNKSNWLGAPGTENTWYGVSADSGNMTVVGLFLGNNNLVGTIPASLGNLVNLNTLQLNSNKLTGSIPASLGNLANLQQLSLFSNQLTGSIPAEIGNLSSLTSLYLFSNQLTGSIPPGLGALSGMQYLDLHDNQFTGEIPSDLGNLGNLLSLYLCNNQLTGSIPSSLGTLSKLQILFLHTNQLTGSLPSSLGSLSNLTSLFLFSNRLSGSIPSSLGSLSKLTSLYLFANQLSGSIPTSFTNLTGLSSASTGIANNALHASDAALIAFLNSKEQNWASTQTIAPTNVSAVPGTGSATVSWTPIPYTGETGGYRIFYGTVAGGPYTLFAQTANKSATSQVVSGLTPGFPYYFVVKTRTEAHAGNLNVVDSENSDEVTATPLIVPGGAMTVTSPNGGENWLLGSTHSITWTSAGTIANVKIEYSTDNGSTWTTIFASTPNDGIQSWTSGSPTNPALNTLSTTCRVRLSEAAGVAAPDVSDTAFAISATGFIAGTVTDLSAAPIPDVYVQVYDLNNVWISRGWTNASGQYWIGGLAAGSYKVVYFNDATRNFLFEWYNDKRTFNAATPVAVTLNNTTANINAQLAAGGIISGRITDENGAGLANVGITAWVENGLFGYWTATSDSSGNYRVKGLPAGNSKLMFGLSGYPSKFYGNFYSSEQSTAVSVSLGVETSGINMTLEKGGWISGAVTNGSGNPVSGIQVLAFDATDNGYLRASGGLTAADGTYSVLVRPGQTKVYFDASVKPSSGLRSQFSSNQTSFAAAGAVSVVKDQTTPNVNAVLAAGGGTLTINVTNGLGQGVPAVVYLYNPLVETRMTLAVWTEANGYVQIKGLLPGNYKVKAYDSNGDLGRYNTEWYNNALAFGPATAVGVTEGGTTPVSIVLNDTILPPGVPTIGLSKTSINFGSERNGTPTPAEPVILTSGGTGLLNWTATPSTNWISVSPGSGTGSRVLTVGISRTDMSPGYYTGTIAITDPNASNSPQTITVGLDILPVNTDSPPFGNYATPIDGSTVASSIPVTGWVLDDVGVVSVKIYRGTGLSDRIYIGDAVFSRGSRPDVEAAYPGYPENDRAGWGYMLLTNFLPNGGNGPFTLLAYATDTAGHEVLLGSKAIILDNLNAAKPFGAIDTPTQGGTVSGAAFVNFGWALTPQPKFIPLDGSTITVWIDGLPLGHPVYNNPRADISALFPGFANTDGAVGYYYLNTTGYENRVHTIAWSVGDSAGAADGIGSRYFTVQNVSGESATAEITAGVDKNGTALSLSPYKNTGLRSASEIAAIPEDGRTPVYVNRGYAEDPLADKVFPDTDGLIRIEIPEVSRVAIYLQEKGARESRQNKEARSRRILTGLTDSDGASRYEAYELVRSELRPLPIGAAFDARSGAFTWQPGPGFLGEYQFVIIDAETMTRRSIKIVIEPEKNTRK